MIKNIGAKLKLLSNFICAGGIIVSAICGFFLIFYDMVLPGILTIAFGALASWFSSWIVYALGEIAENTEIIRASCTKEDITKDKN